MPQRQFMDERFRRAVSDISVEVNKAGKHCNLGEITEVQSAECECCGLHEDCTPKYIRQVKDYYCGKWVCGLCSEAVKEYMNRAPKTEIETAIESHAAFRDNFNKTIKDDPKLALARAMRDVIKVSFRHRNANKFSKTKIGRCSSCMPNIEVEPDGQNL